MAAAISSGVPTGSPARAADLVPFKVGEASPANTFLAIWMAEAAGLYEAQGLKLEIVRMTGGSQAGPSLMKGDIQLMHIGLSSVIRANAAGADLRAIGSLSNVIRFTLFSAPNIRTAADLKGGTIGISSTGSESDATITLALRKLGMTRQDVTIKEIGLKRLAAVKAGEVAATALNEPDRSQAFAQGLNPLVDLVPDQVPWLFSGLVVARPYLKDHRDLVARFMKATVEGNYLALADEKKAKEVLTKELGISDPKIIDISYADFKAGTPANAEIPIEGAKNNISVVAQPNASQKVEDYVDPGILDALKAEGFFAAMQAKYARK